MHMRIGEVAERTGVNRSTLRAWEHRYGVLRPRRSPGGHRVYDDEDVARVRAVVAVVAAGARVSEAVRRLATGPDDLSGAAEEVRLRLWEAVDAFDETAAAAALSTATATLGVPAVLDTVVVPTLRRLGAEWRQSLRNVAREHFTSTLVRSHLVSLLPRADAMGPSCLAFCPEGEQHDIGLLMAALTLAGAGRSQIVLGANTPLASIELLVRELRPAVVLVAAATRRPVVRFLAVWRPPAGCVTFAGGAGFRPGDVGRLGGRVHLEPYAALPAAVAAAADRPSRRSGRPRRPEPGGG